MDCQSYHYYDDDPDRGSNVEDDTDDRRGDEHGEICEDFRVEEAAEKGSSNVLHAGNDVGCEPVGCGKEEKRRVGAGRAAFVSAWAVSYLLPELSRCCC